MALGVQVSHACCWLAGGGITQIVMPYLTEGIAHHVPEFQAWRYAFFFPGCLQILWALMILTFGQVHYPSLIFHFIQNRHGTCT